MDYRTIIEHIESQNPDCLEHLYEAYGKKFYGYCIHKWKLSEDEAWDVVYKTLETLVLKGHTYHFESETHFKNFLYKVLLNFLRQQYRSAQSSKVSLHFVDLDNSDTLPPFLINEVIRWKLQFCRQYHKLWIS
jgi:DNA-directed RNA polymerase specialized sigma24 family protein